MTNNDTSDTDLPAPAEQLYAQPQRVTRRMMERDRAYPVCHCIYQEQDDGTLERLCDRNFAGGNISESHESIPQQFESLADGWDEYQLLGDGISCSDCGEIAVKQFNDGIVPNAGQSPTVTTVDVERTVADGVTNIIDLSVNIDFICECGTEGAIGAQQRYTTCRGCGTKWRMEQ